MITTRLMAITLPSCLHDYKVNQRCLSVKCIRPHDTQPFLWSYQDKHKIGSPLYIPDIRRIHSQGIQLCVPDTKLQARLTTPLEKGKTKITKLRLAANKLAISTNTLFYTEKTLEQLSEPLNTVGPHEGYHPLW